MAPSVVRRAALYAIVVGTILVVINHGDALLRGEVDGLRLLRMGLSDGPLCGLGALQRGRLTAGSEAMTDSVLGMAGEPLDRLLRRDRAVVLAAVLALAGASWAYIAYLAMEMGRMDMAMAMPMARAWTAVDLLLLWVMWAVMMVAMMLPSAAPMILLFTSIQRRRRDRAHPYVPAGVFLLGYVLVWALYSALATLLQWGLHSAALLSSMMVSTSALLGGGLLIGAGIFQFTPLKNACLSACRSPMGFLSTEWREGARGALAMGFRHGTFCVGCCWILMALLFVVGVMNLLWVAAIAGFVLVEKLAPAGKRAGQIAGAALIVAGLWMII